MACRGASSRHFSVRSIHQLAPLGFMYLPGSMQQQQQLGYAPVQKKVVGVEKGIKRNGEKSGESGKRNGEMSGESEV